VIGIGVKCFGSSRKREEEESLMAGSGTALGSDWSFQPSDKLLSSLDYRRSRARLLRRIASDPQASHYLELAWLEYRKRHYEAAKETVEKALQQMPQSAEAHLLLAMIFERLEKMEEAGEMYRKLLREHPDFSPAYREYARYLLATEGTMQAAESHLLRGLELNPRDGLGHALLAEVYAGTGRRRQALLHLEIANWYHEGDTLLHQRCAKVLMQVGEFHQAVEHLRLAVEADPRNKEIRSLFRVVKRSQEKKRAFLFPVFPFFRKRLRS
jgi:tetratricopeptide (TPR) repeat protein